MSDSISVTKREETGSLRMKRLRQTGQIPGVLYGHGKETVMLSIKESELNRAINAGSYIVQLEGGVTESALIKDVQWDAFGSNVIHVDLTRIDAKEAVEVSIPVELKGDAPGSAKGGVVKFHNHEITINCPADKLPEKLELKITSLDLDQTLTASEIELPAGATLVSEPGETIASCSLPAGESGGDGETAAGEGSDESEEE